MQMETPPVQPAGSRPRPQPVVVLVVEDDAAVRELVSELLTREGYTVLTASHVHEAHRHLREHAVDVVVLDLLLQDEQGRLVLDRPGRSGAPAVVIISGLPVPSAIADHPQVAAILPKPFDLEELLAAVDKAARWQRPDL
jgi:DNA-binding response OmpR family regulator